MTLARKQSSEHADWLVAAAAITAAPDRDRARALVQAAAARVSARVHAAHGPVAYAWSGGKDSQGLRVVAEAAGVTESVLVITALEFPAFLAWVTDHMPWGLTVHLRERLNLTWLAAHPTMLFPPDAATASRWFAQVQHAGQRAYARAAGLDVLLLGRRRADGNYLGRDGTPHAPEYRDRDGFARVSPIANWSHEDLLHVLATYEMDLPPCYGWPRGYRVGTGPWPARQWTGTQARGWAEVATIDPGVVEQAARAGIPGAAACAA